MVAAMGEVYAHLKVHGPLGTEEVERVLIDTGATHSMVDRALADRLGIEPEATMKFVVVGGEVELPMGPAILELEGRRFTVPVVLGDRNLVGLTTLETLQFTVDPIGGRLVPRAGILFPAAPLAA